MAESLHDNIANKSNCELTSRLGAKSIALKPAKKHKFYTLLQILVVQSPDFTVFRKNLTRNSRRALKKCLIGKKERSRSYPTVVLYGTGMYVFVVES